MLDDTKELDEKENEVCEMREDTPAVAVSRQREVLWLREVLLDLTKNCGLVQREPGNVLTRFLLSSMLTRPGTACEDPLLPKHDSYDQSLCSELRKTGMPEEEVLRICTKLCAASREAAVRVEAARLNESVATASSASYARISGAVSLIQQENNYRSIWQNEVVPISSPHLYTLRRLYGKYVGEDGDETLFQRRLFCCLKRYDALGGPTYQCSVTNTTFCALEAEFGCAKECFASPFNHNAALYWSAFPDTDRFFGSQGDFFRSLDSSLVQEGGFFYANPPFVEEYLERLREAVERVLALQTAVTFAVVLPTWTDTPCYKWMQRNELTRVHLVLAAGEHEYVDGRQQINTTRWRKRHVSPFSSTLFILQNKEASIRCPINCETKLRVLGSFERRRNR